MKAYQTDNVRIGTRTGTRTASVSERISTATLAVAGSAGLAIGLWSFAAVIGGLASAGGPLGLARGYFSAVSGL